MAANSFLNIPQPTQNPFSIGALLGGLFSGGTVGQAADMRTPTQASIVPNTAPSTTPSPASQPTSGIDPMALIQALMGGAKGGAVDPNLAAILHASRPDPHDVRSWQDRAGAWGSSNFTPQAQWDAQKRTPQPMNPTVGNFLAGGMGGAAGGY